MSENSEIFQYSGRTAPQAIDAEVFLLGGVLQDSNVLVEIVPILEVESFYQERHQIIWNTILELYKINTPIDIVTLCSALDGVGKLQAVGGKDYIFQLMESVASAANAKWHAELIQKKAALRSLITSANKTIRSALDSSAEPEEIIQEAERDIMDLAEKRVRDSMRPAGAVVNDVLKSLENRKGGMTGCPTGFADLDRLTNGLQPSDLIILAGRPGMGKTAFALTLAANAAINFGKKVAFFSLEMGGEQLVQRILCSRAQIDMGKLRSGNLRAEDFHKIPQAAQPIINSSLYIDDNADLGIMELLSKTRSLKSKIGLDLVVVDYLQLMKTGKEENRAVAIGAISRGLKILAKDLKIPVIALAQLSRKAEEKGRERPQLSDLRESGSIEQDADMVWFVERSFYRSHNEEEKTKAQLLVAKHRNGSTADIDLTWIAEYTTFYDYVEEDNGGNFGFGSDDL